MLYIHYIEIGGGLFLQLSGYSNSIPTSFLLYNTVSQERLIGFTQPCSATLPIASGRQYEITINKNAPKCTNPVE